MSQHNNDVMTSFFKLLTPIIQSIDVTNVAPIPVFVSYGYCWLMMTWLFLTFCLIFVSNLILLTIVYWPSLNEIILFYSVINVLLTVVFIRFDIRWYSFDDPTIDIVVILFNGRGVGDDRYKYRPIRWSIHSRRYIRYSGLFGKYTTIPRDNRCWPTDTFIQIHSVIDDTVLFPILFIPWFHDYDYLFMKKKNSIRRVIRKTFGLTWLVFLFGIPETLFSIPIYYSAIQCWGRYHPIDIVFIWLFRLLLFIHSLSCYCVTICDILFIYSSIRYIHSFCWVPIILFVPIVGGLYSLMIHSVVFRYSFRGGSPTFIRPLFPLFICSLLFTLKFRPGLYDRYHRWHSGRHSVHWCWSIRYSIVIHDAYWSCSFCWHSFHVDVLHWVLKKSIFIQKNSLTSLFHSIHFIPILTDRDPVEEESLCGFIGTTRALCWYIFIWCSLFRCCPFHSLHLWHSHC